MKIERERNILYVGGFELPDKNAAAQRVIGNAKIFKELGFSVSFLGIDKNLNTEANLIDTKSIFEEFVYYNLPYPKSFQEWYSYLFNMSYSSLIKLINPSLIIAYNYPAFSLKKLHKYCKNENIQLIADCTEWYFPKGNLFFRLIKGIDTWYRMRIIHNQIDGVIAISSYLYNYYLRRDNNVLYIPPLVDKTMEKWSKITKKEIYFSGISLVYAGSPGKGEKDSLDSIINALYEVKNNSELAISLNIVGITKEQYIQLFKPDKSLLIGIVEFVSFKGRVSHLEALNIVKSSDYQIFLRNNNLSNNAGFPTKFVEAISCGTPVLTNLTSNIEMYLKDGVNGFTLDITSGESLYKSLSYALSHSKDEISRMKDNCLSSTEFDFKTYINDVSLFLEETLV